MLCRTLLLTTFAATPLSAMGGGEPCPGQVLYVATTSDRIYRIDNYWSSPKAVLLGDTGVGTFTDIAVDQTTAELLGIDAASQNLYRLDRDTLQATLIGNTGVTLNALETSPGGTIYGRGGDQLLYELDPLTAVATVVGDTGSASGGDLALEATGFLLGANNFGEIDRIDPQTGQGTILGSHGLSNVWGLEVDCDGTLYAFTNDGDLYVIDPGTMGTTLIGNIGIAHQVWGMAFRLGPSLGDVGTNYCGPANLNSSGQSAVIAGTGSEVVLLNLLELHATQLPPDRFGYFLNSETQAFLPFSGGSQGNLCLGGVIGRHAKQVQNSGFAGEFSIQVDLTQLPTPSGSHQVLVGETWNFQAWFRDANPGHTTNFTDALSILFL